MSYRLFGAKKILRSYATARTAFSAIPNFAEPGKAPAFAYYTTVLHAVEEVAEVAITIAADAETKPAPEAPQTLQELVEAARVRLRKDRARKNRDERNAAVTHIKELRELIKP